MILIMDIVDGVTYSATRLLADLPEQFSVRFHGPWMVVELQDGTTHVYSAAYASGAFAITAAE